MISGFFGGDKRDRTADLLNAIQALSQTIPPRSARLLSCVENNAICKYLVTSHAMLSSPCKNCSTEIVNLIFSL